MKRFLRTVQRNLAPAAGMLLLAAMTAGGVQARDCNRACMTGMITKYLDALAAHDPSRLPLAAKVRFTEDSQDLKLGEGLWKTVVKMGGFRQDYIDQKAHIAAAHINMFEADGQVLHSVLLRVDNRKITGIETQVFRVKDLPKSDPPDAIDQPLAEINVPVPAGQRMPRAEAIRIALLYAEGLKVGDWAGVKTPFAKEAYRKENGHFTAGVGCAKCPPMLNRRPILKHPDLTSSVAAVDEEAGIVVLWMNFGDTNTFGPGNSLVTFEAFKVWGGEIHAINAFFRILPKDIQRGWPSTDKL
jgi:hypothetical protein